MNYTQTNINNNGGEANDCHRNTDVNQTKHAGVKGGRGKGPSDNKSKVTLPQSLKPTLLVSRSARIRVSAVDYYDLGKWFSDLRSAAMMCLKELGRQLDHPFGIRNRIGLIELACSSSLEKIHSDSLGGSPKREGEKPTPIQTAEKALSALTSLIDALIEWQIEYARFFVAEADTGATRIRVSAVNYYDLAKWFSDLRSAAMMCLKELGRQSDNPFEIRNDTGLIKLAFSSSLEKIHSDSPDGSPKREGKKPKPIQTAEKALPALTSLADALIEWQIEYARFLAVEADTRRTKAQ